MKTEAQKISGTEMSLFVRGDGSNTSDPKSSCNSLRVMYLLTVTDTSLLLFMKDYIIRPYWKTSPLTRKVTCVPTSTVCCIFRIITGGEIDEKIGSPFCQRTSSSIRDLLVFPDAK